MIQAGFCLPPVRIFQRSVLMKRFMSFVLCAVMAFVFTAGTGWGESLGFDAAVVSEAAGYEKAMLPYFYSELSSSEKSAYLKIRSALINGRERLKIQLDSDTVNKLMNIMYTSDVLVCFNIKSAEWVYSTWTGLSEVMTFGYNFSREDYRTILEKTDEYAEKVISRFTEKTSDYAKIKYIHDYIINRCDYEIESPAANNAYGALVNRLAKCDGYAHAFNYICTKAGIRAVTVCGKEKDAPEDAYHAWNKVYCGKKWYNVDLTWDDPLTNVRDNKRYDYFMVSDKVMSATHAEISKGFTIPAAKDDSLNYYDIYGLTAESSEEAGKILASGIAAAADKGRSVASVRIRNKNAVSKMKNSGFIADILAEADEMSEADIITSVWQTGMSGDSTFTIMFFRKGTKLSDYYRDTDALDGETRRTLISAGIENA